MNIVSTHQKKVIDPLRLWEARTEFFGNIRWTFAVTLTYGEWPISMDRIRRDLRGLHAAVDRKLYGTRFYKKTIAERTRFVAFVEEGDCYPHLHSMWRVPGGQFVRFAALFRDGLWSGFAPRGTHKLRIPDADRGWCAYSTKDFKLTDEWIWSDEFLPSR